MTHPAEDRAVLTPDGLTLDVRRFEGGAKTPAVCIPGLTRNRRDFDDFAPWLAAAGRDVYALSLRGRGASDYDPDYLNYHPLTYRADILGAMDQLGVPRAIFIGTSLGGIVSMLTNEAAPGRVAAAILNDVGPELAPEGLARIAAYAGAERAEAASFEEAAVQIRALNEVAFPGRDAAFWRDFALKTFRKTERGTFVLDYDPAIGRALAKTGPPPDLWPAFASLKDTPTLVIHGAASDILTAEIVESMRAVHPRFELCEVPGVGHAPTLMEPEVVAAVEAFLGEID